MVEGKYVVMKVSKTRVYIIDCDFTARKPDLVRNTITIEINNVIVLFHTFLLC